MSSLKYIAFLRGINVGGKNIIKMVDLKNVVEKAGFTNVSTYIQSGNVIFESSETDSQKISQLVEHAIEAAFHSPIKVMIFSQHQLREILENVPKNWENGENLRRYIAFISEPTTAQDVLAVVKLKEGVDSAQTGKGVLYMSSLLTGLTKSGFTKLVGTKVYKNLTIRNYSTVQKILLRMI